MRVAVVIAARDVAPYIGAAVNSVLSQSHADVSLTVVDDGSVDDTRAVVGSFDDTRLHLIRETGRGVSAARNRGAAAVSGSDALLFLDGDDWLAPDALRRLVMALAQDPAAAAAHAPFAFVAAEASPAAPGQLDRRAAPSAPDLLSPLMLGNLFANGGHVLIRTAAWAAAGPFRDDLAFAEDWEFWLRLALQGPFVAIWRAAGAFRPAAERQPHAWRRHADGGLPSRPGGGRGQPGARRSAGGAPLCPAAAARRA